MSIIIDEERTLYAGARRLTNRETSKILENHVILEKLKIVWCSMNVGKSLGQVMTQACANEGWKDIWEVDDKKLEKFLDKKLAEFTLGD